MRLPSLLALCAALSACQSTTDAPVVTEGARATRLISANLGVRNQQDDWAPADSQTTVGLEYSSIVTESGHGYEIGVHYGEGDGVRSGFQVDSQMTEIYLGYRREFDRISAGLFPYFGAGLAFFDGEIEVAGVRSESEADLGFYLHGGMRTWINRALTLGVGARFVTGATLDFQDGSDLDVAGIMPYIQVGFGL